MAGDTVVGGNLLFENWKAAMEVEIEASKAAADNMVKYADANIKNAQAAQEWTKAATLQAVLKQLQIAYRELNNQKAKLNSKLAWLERQRQNLRAINMGHKASAVAAVNLWASFLVLFPELPQSEIDNLSSQAVEPEWRDGANFVHVSNKSTPCENVPGEVTDLYGLLMWLDDKQVYMPKLGRPVAKAIIKAVNMVADTAIPARKELEHEIQTSTDAVYAIWDPVTFAGMERPTPKTSKPS